jgi:hypothetical protein
MSYAGPASGGRARASRTATASPPSRGAAARPGRSPDPARHSTHPEADWKQLAIFGTGLALGIIVGAGAALLTAPRTGAETRLALRSRAGRLGRRTTRRGRDVWDDVRDEIDGARRALHRRKRQFLDDRAARRDLERDLEREADDAV